MATLRSYPFYSAICDDLACEIRLQCDSTIQDALRPEVDRIASLYKSMWLDLEKHESDKRADSQKMHVAKRRWEATGAIVLCAALGYGLARLM